MKKKKNNFFKTYFKNLINLLSIFEFAELDKYLSLFLDVKKNKRKILIFGNGAGASIASHVATDFTKNAKVAAISLDSSTYLTCLSNDYGYENTVTQAIKHYYKSKDLVILLSASGNSTNMIKAARYCNKKSIKFLTITGFKKKNKLNNLSKNKIWINSSSWNLIEITQLSILLSYVDKIIGKINYKKIL
tara:strand:+ start:3027 stop:3596 length:570 start_codon:yes stop_codon:yes gene_type:complete